ncbi:MAG: ATP synthase F1 subunit gamma [Candidatus Magasanikbacteria bacterium]|jgi:F-type H+-transporting ATPase subunit gamma|nr:ATP synthase F1 subunit gamma [Candidatus Magasanikbacteria bacterium]MBT4315294.1 ATP synthase F1 subunit gamma [Candidatus Magasanikbacteria bacterium]MBT4547166.1 ATP synthase F1 subunit gamma [Candidatus Magasanikbacteria bacterium]MBT6819702.1 ATP synthase F1 subunit gamma [Candidatus Magasanikbacteria bacterium]
MGVNTKAIKSRIKSVGNTKKITKAMEMVAAAKMRKATEAALNTRTYATMAWDLLVSLSKVQKEKLPLLDVRPVKKLLVVLITSNRGLCGSFNSNIIRKTSAQLKDPKNISRQRTEMGDMEASEEVEIDVIGIGKKGADFAKKNNYNLIASYSEFSDTPKLDAIMPISQMIIDEYTKGNYDKVVVAYTDFKSAIAQVAKFRQVLPVSETDIEKMIGELGSDKDAKDKENEEKKEIADYVFEPSKSEVLETILPRLVETQVYQAVLESSASEHSARMMAMRNASDAAEDMIKELNLTFNKARQAAITQEIAEIAGGAAALE